MTWRSFALAVPAACCASLAGYAAAQDAGRVARPEALRRAWLNGLPTPHAHRSALGVPPNRAERVAARKLRIVSCALY